MTFAFTLKGPGPEANATLLVATWRGEGVSAPWTGWKWLGQVGFGQAGADLDDVGSERPRLVGALELVRHAVENHGHLAAHLRGVAR